MKIYQSISLYALRFTKTWTLQRRKESEEMAKEEQNDWRPSLNKTRFDMIPFLSLLLASASVVPT